MTTQNSKPQGMITITDFRVAMQEMTDFPSCCLLAMKRIDDALVEVQSLKGHMFIATFVPIFMIPLAGGAGKLSETAAEQATGRALEKLQEVGIQFMGDQLDGGMDIPQFFSALTQFARAKALPIITAHLQANSSAGCKQLRKTNKFWRTMANAFHP